LWAVTEIEEEKTVKASVQNWMEINEDDEG